MAMEMVTMAMVRVSLQSTDSAILEMARKMDNHEMKHKGLTLELLKVAIVWLLARWETTR